MNKLDFYGVNHSRIKLLFWRKSDFLVSPVDYEEEEKRQSYDTKKFDINFKKS